MKNDIIIFLAKYLVFIIALIAGAYWLQLKNNKKPLLAAKIILAAILAMVVAKILGKFYYDTRPFVSAHIQPLVTHSADNGFPSEHTTLSMVIASVLYFYNRRLGYGLLVLTVLVGLGRIWAHVHSPIDILGGLVIGGAAAWAANWASDRWLAGYFAQQTDK